MLAVKICDNDNVAVAVSDLKCGEDVLVDGVYKCDERDVTLAFRGSRNQRVINLKNGEEMF